METPPLRLALVDTDERTLATLRAAGLECVTVPDEGDGRALLAAGRADALLLGADAEAQHRQARLSLAHDLRGPLAMLRGHAELLLMTRDAGVDPDDWRESIEAIHEAVDRLATLVRERIELR